jgi:GAF domain
MSFLQNIINSGVKQGMSISLKGRIRLSNRLGFVLISLGIFLIIAFSSRSATIPYPLLILVFTGGIIPWLNSIGLHRFTRLIISILPLIVVLLYDISEKARHVPDVDVITFVSPHFVIVATLTIPMTLFVLEEWLYILVCVLIILGASLFFDSIYAYFGVHFSLFGIQSKAYSFVLVNIIVVIVILLSTVLYLLISNYKNDKYNQDILERLQKHNQRLIEQEDQLQESLKLLEESKKEIENQHWLSTGLAQFSNLLRTEKDQKKLFNNLISDVSKHIGALQSALYLCKQDDEQKQYLELSACYAISIEKYESKRFDVDEGLIGQAFSQCKMIKLRDIPESYFKIGSGLGAALPSTLVILPLVHLSKCYGVMEFASFEKLETYQIDFLQKIAEAIATTLANFQLENQSKKLLDEAQLKTELLELQSKELVEKEQFYLGMIEELQKNFEPSELNPNKNSPFQIIP